MSELADGSAVFLGPDGKWGTFEDWGGIPTLPIEPGAPDAVLHEWDESRASDVPRQIGHSALSSVARGAGTAWAVVNNLVEYGIWRGDPRHFDIRVEALEVAAFLFFARWNIRHYFRKDSSVQPPASE